MSGIEWQNYGVDEVDVAFEADSAKEILSERAFDIILCDIEMPGDNGIDLIRWVRKKNLDIEVIFLTCHADFEFAQEAIRLGCRNYILIPAAYEVIAENVQEVVLEIEKKREARKQEQYGKLWMAEKEKEHELQTISHSPEKTVQNVEEYIMRHLNDTELGLNQIASHMYLNSDYLNRIFKKLKGTSIGKYILEKRMNMASDMLKEGKFGATKISELVGYNSYSSFVAAFKNYYGCSPSKYLEVKS
jgi:YesN/AraC family two-component response regulator